MRNKKFLIIFIFITAVIVLFIASREKSSRLFSPNLTKDPLVTVSTSSSSIPKTFKFDRSTDLKKELQNVDPQVLDSDFE